MCCFHYLQLGPETAFRVEYSRAALPRIAVYIERSLVIASSLFLVRRASGGKYESVVSGDHPCCAALHCISLLLSVPPPAQIIGRKQERLKASESPATATLTIHTNGGIKKYAVHTNRREAPIDTPFLKISLFMSCLLHSNCCSLLSLHS